MKSITIILGILGILILAVVLSGGVGTDCSKLKTKNQCNNITECTDTPFCKFIFSEN
jgi:hypothetical protein